MNIPDEIRREMRFTLPIQRVWKAISTPEGLSHWFSDRVEMDPQPGGEINFDWEEYGKVQGKVEALEPPHRFTFRWGAHGSSRTGPFTSENSTLVTFFLEEDAQGTRLIVHETGFAGLETDLQEDAWRENDRGWTVELGELQEYLSTLEGA